MPRGWWWVALAFAAGWLLHSGWHWLMGVVYPTCKDRVFEDYIRKEYGGE